MSRKSVADFVGCQTSPNLAAPTTAKWILQHVVLSYWYQVLFSIYQPQVL